MSYQPPILYVAGKPCEFIKCGQRHTQPDKFIHSVCWKNTTTCSFKVPFYWNLHCSCLLFFQAVCGAHCIIRYSILLWIPPSYDSVVWIKFSARGLADSWHSFWSLILWAEQTVWFAKANRSLKSLGSYHPLQPDQVSTTDHGHYNAAFGRVDIGAGLHAGFDLEGQGRKAEKAQQWGHHIFRHRDCSWF